MSTNQKYPTIHHLDDVLPYIENFKEFKVYYNKEHEFYAVDYNYMDDNTFSKEVPGYQYRRECRGLKFDRNKKILARGYHKFFNINENEENNVKNLLHYKYFTILEKIDGSLIFPIEINGTHRLTSRFGITDVAIEAENFIKDKYNKFFQYCSVCNITPLFEFCGEKNRVVLKYDPQFILTGIRNTVTGEYYDYNQIREIAHNFDVKYVKQHNTLENIDTFMDFVKDSKGIEGFVLYTPDQQIFKVKSLEYVMKHRALSGFLYENNIVKLILNNKEDDILPMLDEDQKNALLNFKKDFLDNILSTIDKINKSVQSILPSVHTDKEFALYCESTIIPEFKPFAYICYKQKKDIKDEILKYVEMKTSKQSALDKVKVLYGNINWKDYIKSCNLNLEEN